MDSSEINQAAIELQVLRLLDSFPLPAATDGAIDAYCKALEGLDPEAVLEAVGEFCTGVLNRNHTYRPNAAEVATRARLWHQVKHPKPRVLALPPPEKPIPPEERARVREGFKSLAQTMQQREDEAWLQVQAARAARHLQATDRLLERDERPLQERLGRLAEPVSRSA